MCKDGDRDGGIARVIDRQCCAMRGNATTSLRKITRWRRSERTTRDIGSKDDDCSDDSNGDSDGDADSGYVDSGDNDNNSDSGGGDSNSSRNNNNQLIPASEEAATAVNAALASILLAS
jgi:hypothetical protein